MRKYFVRYNYHRWISGDMYKIVHAQNIFVFDDITDDKLLEAIKGQFRNLNWDYLDEIESITPL